MAGCAHGAAATSLTSAAACSGTALRGVLSLRRKVSPSFVGRGLASPTHSHLAPCFYPRQLQKQQQAPDNVTLSFKQALSHSCSLTPGLLRANTLSRSERSHGVSESTTAVPVSESQESPPGNGGDGGGGGGGGDDGEGAIGWVSSGFIFCLWAAFVAYAFFFSPNQTPVLDQYLVERLLFFKQDEGYEVNGVLFSLWNVMGIWPIIYCMLLIPSGRSPKSGVPIWPFTSVGLFVGAFALLPYFGLWRPSSVTVSKEELDRWPLKTLDSKILSIALVAAGTFLIGNAFLSGSEAWIEFRRLFYSSRLTHVTTLDFIALSLSAPFWVFNDMEVRKWSSRAFWVSALAFIPLLGPALYVVLRPPLKPYASVEEIGGDGK